MNTCTAFNLRDVLEGNIRGDFKVTMGDIPSHLETVLRSIYPEKIFLKLSIANNPRIVVQIKILPKAEIEAVIFGGVHSKELEIMCSLLLFFVNLLKLRLKG